MAILTDSMSLIQALRNKSTCTKTLRNILEELSNNVGMLLKWVPGHKDIPGNELADKYAKEAASAARAPATNSRVNHEDQEKDITVSYNAARSYIKRKVQDGPRKHARTAAVYKNINRKRDLMAVKNRKEGALLAELRSCQVTASSYRNIGIGLGWKRPPPVLFVKKKTKMSNIGC